jgi:hypothetical protein
MTPGEHSDIPALKYLNFCSVVGKTQESYGMLSDVRRIIP